MDAVGGMQKKTLNKLCVGQRLQSPDIFTKKKTQLENVTLKTIIFSRTCSSDRSCACLETSRTHSRLKTTRSLAPQTALSLSRPSPKSDTLSPPS